MLGLLMKPRNLNYLIVGFFKPARERPPTDYRFDGHAGCRINFV